MKNVSSYNPKEPPTKPNPAPKKQEHIPLVIKTLKNNLRGASETTVEDTILSETNRVDFDQDAALKENLFSYEDDPDDCFKDSYILTMTQRFEDGDDVTYTADFDITRLDDVNFELCPEVRLKF